MAKIGGGDPSKIWKGNFMGCTRTIHLIIMVNGLKKNRGIEKPTKRVDPIVQGIAKKIK